ncbi:hypothetical protein [Streptomyces ipomoeae]|uniref:hypothetical protein n=1 Tax=Streptomyces ipomoeae TaxID=103232 RepID=UPI00114693C6|nr:hypothetical protein [Streptomyces ipomoeae]MDX2933559.1 hypothetical protein [Streptomyces ipomoeae]TQE22259.1 hypothetical protein SipoB123_24145 [Streptomyces ipomoeae]
MNKLIAGAMTTVAVGAMVPLLAAAPATADAQAKVCKPGATKITWVKTAKTPTLTNGKLVVATKPERLSVRAPKVTTIRAAVTGPGKPAAVLASLSKQTKLRLAPVKEATPNLVGVTAKIKAGKSVFYAGTTKATGTYTIRTCNSKGTGYGAAKKGTAVSWNFKLTRNAVHCSVKTVDPLAAAAQKKFCR